MKCPSCGAEIGNARFCPYCGSQISADMLRENEILNKVGCPRCGSTNVSFSRENQGEIRGEKSKRIIHYTVGVCKDCGYTWRTDGEQKKKNSGTLSRLFNWLKTDNRWLWILGWLYIFPLPLTLILLKKKEMQSALKYGIIAAAWILYLVLGLVFDLRMVLLNRKKPLVTLNTSLCHS
ncbi:MAG: zinc ribbon domain-containing protein, partial [Clostridia bacterium]|nr:zinc ribbon domain-containing protein [Clostridia bacterium]